MITLTEHQETVQCLCKTGTTERIELKRGQTLQLRLRSPNEDLLIYSDATQRSCIEVTVHIRTLDVD